MGKKALVADDDRAFLEVAKEFLKNSGYKVATADNGEKALKLAESEKPDMILLDVIMPGKDGFEVCRELKNKKKTKDMVIIIMSGKVREIEKGFDYGADDCIIKPIDWKKLSERLKEI